jgi:hypothetical protein
LVTTLNASASCRSQQKRDDWWPLPPSMNESTSVTHSDNDLVILADHHSEPSSSLP